MVGKLQRDTVIARGKGPTPIGFADELYLFELNLQCEFAIRSYGEIMTRVKRGENDLSILAYCHMMLVFGGNISKILFSSPKAGNNQRSRAERLRASLGLNDSEPEAVRKARNYFEHFDERMDQYLASHDGLLIHRHIGDHLPSEIEMDDGRRFVPNYLQFFNTSTQELILYDQSINIGNLADGISRLQQIVEGKLRKTINSGEKVTP